MNGTGTRVVAVARQSRGDGASVEEQRERLEAHAGREGWRIVELHEERDVSGGRPLSRRPGLLAAVQAIEAHEADVLCVAYFDRLVRSLQVQAEVVSRVEAAGGRVLTLDVGEVSEATAASWLSGSMLGLVAEYHRRTTKERVHAAHERLVLAGRWVGGRMPLGYRLDATGRLEPDPETAGLVLEAYQRRERGDSLEQIRAWLREQGVPTRSLNVVQTMLRNRVYLGELKHGALRNPQAHEAIVPADLYRRVQARSYPRGRRPPSERLLARLGILRCGTCGSRMVVASAASGSVPTYRCPPGNECGRKQSITAGIVEDEVVDAVVRLLADVEGSASPAAGVDEAERELEAAERELEAAVQAFSGLEDVEAARRRLIDLRGIRDEARDRLDVLRAAERPALTIQAGRDRDLLTRDELRALIRATLDHVEVRPGRGAARVVVFPRGQALGQ